MMVKVSSENLAALGATDAADFNAKLTAFIAEANQNKTFMAESKTTLETLQASVTALEGKLSALPAALTKADVTAAVAEWAGSEAGKKIIGAESSRIAMEALAAVGTQPAKPSPAGAGGDNQTGVQALEAAGKFEEAWAVDKNIQAEFPTAKGYAAFRRAQSSGQIRIVTKN